MNWGFKIYKIIDDEKGKGRRKKKVGSEKGIEGAESAAIYINRGWKVGSKCGETAKGRVAVLGECSERVGVGEARGHSSDGTGGRWMGDKVWLAVGAATVRCSWVMAIELLTRWYVCVAPCRMDLHRLLINRILFLSIYPFIYLLLAQLALNWHSIGTQWVVLHPRGPRSAGQ